MNKKKQNYSMNHGILNEQEKNLESCYFCSLRFFDDIELLNLVNTTV
jgi:hypothetical protein